MIVLAIFAMVMYFCGVAALRHSGARTSEQSCVTGPVDLIAAHFEQNAKSGSGGVFAWGTAYEGSERSASPLRTFP